MNRTLALTLAATLAAGPALGRQRRVVPENLLNNVQAVQQNRLPFNQRGFNGFALGNEFGDEPAVVERKPFDGVLTARKIARAIDDGVLYLKRQQAEDGSIGESHYARGGSTALAALAMLAAGASPLSDPQLQRALDFLATLEVDNTYVHGIRANVWEYALRKVPDHAGYKKALWADAEWLMQALGDRQAWRYGMSSQDWDNSCTQYGVLGLWAAERAGFDPGDAFWQKMSDHFLKVQSEDGGWGYQQGYSTANMATAGLASTFLVFDMLHARTVYSRANPRAFKEGASAQVLAAVERGMEWLGKQEGGMDNGYFLYGIERTGVASGRKYMGRLDWFREGARVVLGQQAADGSFPNSYTPVLGTAFSTLFLVYGGAPVALNKLEYGPGHDWNLNPRDLAQVSRHLWGAFERPVNWHAVHIDAPVEELEAPILFISGTEAAAFTDAQVDRLRDYIQRGGTILAEPTDQAPAFKSSMEALVGRLFPAAEYPGRTLAPLPATHPVFTASRHAWQTLPQIRGVSDGSRLVFLLSDEYLSARWQVGETVDEAFDFAQSLLFYVTDQKPLAGKFSTALPEGPAQPARERKLLVARAVVDRSADAELGARAWAGLSEFFTHRTGARIQDLGVVALTPGGLEGVDLLHITGRGRFTLDAAERAALVGFVEGGGTLLVDAWGGSAGFAQVARAELTQVFGPLEALERQDPVATGDFEGGTDLSRDIRYTLPGRRLLQTVGRAMPVRGQSLWTQQVHGRAAVFFSDLDLSAALAGVGIPGGAGYRPDSARRIVTNLAAWLVRET